MYLQMDGVTDVSNYFQFLINICHSVCWELLRIPLVKKFSKLRMPLSKWICGCSWECHMNISLDIADVCGMNERGWLSCSHFTVSNLEMLYSQRLDYQIFGYQFPCSLRHCFRAVNSKLILWTCIVLKG